MNMQNGPKASFGYPYIFCIAIDSICEKQVLKKKTFDRIYRYHLICDPLYIALLTCDVN